MTLRGRLRSRTSLLAWLALAMGVLLVTLGNGRAEEATDSAERTAIDPPAAPPNGATNSNDVPEAPDSDADFGPPRLLYLSWQEDGVQSTGKAIPHILWHADGRIVDLEKSQEVLEAVKSFDVHWRQEDGLRPLVLVLDVDEKLKAPAPVLVSVVAKDGSRHRVGSSKTGPSAGMIVSAVAPSKRDLAEWPAEASLEIRYPLENLTVIKTLAKVPDDPIEVAPGVTWYLDPNRAIERDAATGERVRATNKVAAVLQTQREPKLDASFGARIYLRGQDRPVRGSYSTLIEPDGVLHEIDVSNPFDNKAAIEKIEFVRQRHATQVIENVPLHPELLPPEGR